MKIIQSFWSGKINHINDNNFGWISPKYNLLSWVLSANQLRQHYEDVELYTDELGAEILIDKLKLPYSKVHIVLNELDGYHRDLWAISKIKTYSLQDEPFLHVDGDVFIWDAFPEALMQAQLITQNLEVTTDYYRKMWVNIEPHLDYIPDVLETYINTRDGFACNMGIVGGVDIAFYQQYTAEAFKFVNENISAWDIIDNNNFNIFFEQLLYYEMAKKQDKQIGYLFYEIPDDNKYIGFGDFDKVPKEKTFLHLLGNYKKDEFTCRTMENYVLKYYPEYYERLLPIVKEPSFISEKNYGFTKSENEELIANFTSKAQTEANIDNFYFFSRDLAAIGLPARIKELIRSGEDFTLYKLPCNELCMEGEFKEILIKDAKGYEQSIAMDEIDQVLLSELMEPVYYASLMEKLMTYLDDDVNGDALEGFITLINDRIAYFASRKAIGVIN